MRVRSASTTLAAAAVLRPSCLAARTGAALAGPAWTRLRSPNFTLEGNVPESDLRAVARRFEQFREVLNRLLPHASLSHPHRISPSARSSTRSRRRCPPAPGGAAPVSGVEGVVIAVEFLPKAK